MREKRFSGLTLLLVAVCCCVAAAAVTLCLSQARLDTNEQDLLAGYEVILEHYVGDYDADAVVDAGLNAMVKSLGDQWSYYLTAEKYEAQNLNRANHYVGVGVTVGYTRVEGLLVEAVDESSPAEQAGIVAGDVIIAVDGQSIAGDARYEGSDQITGTEGTEVTLTLLHADGTESTVTVVRAEMESNPVTYSMLDGDIGYIVLDNFYERSADELARAVSTLLDAGAQSLLFDMRDNGGGYLSELTNMLDYLLPEGPIFRSRTRTGEEEVIVSDEACITVPVAVLVNESSYSAAEFFAAAMREEAGAYIVGVPTSGKGYAQQTFPLPGGRAMGISICEYTTGQGTSLVGTGVTLDAEVEFSEVGDSQLDAAVAYLTGIQP
ncbi:MAG: S41 family peptidase [Oscillospiraceae bacterium]|nr:S41 family peptidase [Oscillospiraceae bacterium]